MRTAIALALLLAGCKSTPKPEPQLQEHTALHPRSRVDEAAPFVQALREEYQALGRIQAVLRWYTATQGETSLNQLTYLGHDRLFRKPALDAISALEQKPGIAANDALALAFLRRALTSEIVSLATATTFYAADYSRAFALAGMMHEGIRRRFGEDWYANKDVGRFLRDQLFSAGTSLSPEDVAQRLGFPPRVDFEAAAARAQRLVAEADALEKAK